MGSPPPTRFHLVGQLTNCKGNLVLTFRVWIVKIIDENKAFALFSIIQQEDQWACQKFDIGCKTNWLMMIPRGNKIVFLFRTEIGASARTEVLVGPEDLLSLRCHQ